MLADVVLPSRRFQVFTYHIPNQLQAQIFVGSPVLIPLGSSVVSGVVVRILGKTALPSVRSSNPTLSFRDILSVEATPDHSSLDQRLLRLVEHIADYYLAPLSACLRLIVPPRVFNVTKRLVLTEAGREALADVSVPRESQAVLQKLARGSHGVVRSSLFRTLPKAAALVSKLKKKGWIEERSTLPVTFSAKAPEDVHAHHAPVVSSPSRAIGDLFEHGADRSPTLQSRHSVLSGKMKVLTEELEKASLSGKFQKHTVIGTDDERRRVFQQVASTLFQRGRRILFLVPEVHQVEVVTKQLRGILSESVEAYHGQLSTSVRADRW
ncbi:MAG: hypothetical protein VST67_02820, partial [Nitrospirota bacterium]|nr:hypothetical protein [Nitrospirota bacterium]